MFYRIILSVLISCILWGCSSSAEMYQVIPANNKSPHESKTIFIVEDEDASVFLNYNSQTPDYFSFFALIKNKSDSTVFFYPDEIYAEAFRYEAAVDTAKPVYLYSYDPDLKLKPLDEDLTELEESKSVTNTVNCCLVGIFAAVSVGEIGTPEEEKIVNEDTWDDVFDKIDQDEYDYENEKYEIESQMDYWQFEVLQPTSIEPKGKTAGLFYIPIRKDIEWFRIVIPIGEKEYVFNYKQFKNAD